MAIYLDNAATSFPKPETVYLAMDKHSRELGVGAGRGSYQRANDVNRLVEQTRLQLARLINAPEPQSISFCFSGTDALSTAIFGFAHPGDHLITTATDHTSVIRPLRCLDQSPSFQVSIVSCDATGLISTDELETKLVEQSKQTERNGGKPFVCVSHASNVTGAIQPLGKIHEICERNGAYLLVDAAQTIGHIPFDVQELSCDFLAAPGHKGLYGPLGTGFLYVSERASRLTRPLRHGGTGSSHIDELQPKTLPEKYEAGNLNVPGIAGLSAGLAWLETDDAKTKCESLDTLIQKLVGELASIEGVSQFGPAYGVRRAPVISFSIAGIDCQTAGMLLDSQFGIECRTGLHCAPRLHQSLGTAESGGLIRLSPGLFNTDQEIEQAIEAIKSIADSV